MNITLLTHRKPVEQEAGGYFGSTIKKWSTIAVVTALISMVSPVLANDDGDDEEMPFGAAVMIIELTDNDIELQTFVDGVDWKRVRVFDPNEKKIYDARAQRKLKKQGGMSEMFWASEPTHYLEDEPNFDGTIEEFLARFPEGEYEFEGTTIEGGELEDEATLTHVLPALPEIIAPVSFTDEPLIVDRNNLVIEWLPVTTRFMGHGPVEIIEYQVILDQVDPRREIPWVDGSTRRALINLPPGATRVTVPVEFLLPDTIYDFEVLAIESSGNATISGGEFVTSP